MSLGEVPLCTHTPAAPITAICSPVGSVVGSVGQAGKLTWPSVARALQDSRAGGDPVTSKRFAFLCQPLMHDAVMLVLANGSSESVSQCAMAIGSITITAGRKALGVQFSPPYLHTGLGLLVPLSSQETGTWSFLRVFHWDLWLTFVVTMSVVPPILWMVERANNENPVFHIYESSLMVEWRMVTYMLAQSVFNIATYDVDTVPAQMIVIAFSTVVLVVVSTYTANLAAFLSVVQRVSAITGLSSLSMKLIGTPLIYVSRLRTAYYSSQILTTAIPTPTSDTFPDILRSISNGSIAAYADDFIPLALQYSDAGASCTFAMLDLTILPFDLGFAFSSSFPRDMIGNFSIGLLQAQELDQFSQLYTTYFSGLTTGGCSSTGVGSSVLFKQMEGLYIILASTTGFALLWALFTIIARIKQHMREHIERQHLEDKLRPWNQEGALGEGDREGERASDEACHRNPHTLPYKPASTAHSPSEPAAGEFLSSAVHVHTSLPLRLQQQRCVLGLQGQHSLQPPRVLLKANRRAHSSNVLLTSSREWEPPIGSGGTAGTVYVELSEK
ncbi:MAG: hypothetical protein WDW38_008891 [Sanguina aurantia]